jgi:hypothetical protein
MPRNNEQSQEIYVQNRFPDYYAIPNSKVIKENMYDAYLQANKVQASKNTGVAAPGERYNTITDQQLQRLMTELELIEKML